MGIWDLFRSKRSTSASSNPKTDFTEEDNKTDLTITHPMETDGDRANQARLNGGYSDDTFENDITHPITPEDGRNLDVETSNKVIDSPDISRPIVGDEDPAEFAKFTSIADPYGVTSRSDSDNDDDDNRGYSSDDDDDNRGYGSGDNDSSASNDDNSSDNDDDDNDSNNDDDDSDGDDDDDNDDNNNNNGSNSDDDNDDDDDDSYDSDSDDNDSYDD